MRKQPCIALTACLLMGSLSGCSYFPRETRAAYEPVTDATTTAKPLALLPAEGGAIVAVLESRISGIFTQRIVLGGDGATDGENVVIVQIDQTDHPAADLTALPKPTEDGIAHELDANFASNGMQISHAWSHNEFGPFGYAIGKAQGDSTCIYAWQYSQGAQFRLIGDATSQSADASMPAKPTSIRVRLCRQGLSEAQMVSIVRAMQVYPPDGGAPYHDTQYAGIGPLGAGDALQAAGAPGDFFLRPAAPAAPAVKHVSSRTHRHVAHRRSSHIGATPLAMPSASRPAVGVVVPLPSGSPGPSAGAANPLLAPLQSAPQPRSVSASDDMPLPGAVGAPNAAAASTARTGSTVPLPK